MNDPNKSSLRIDWFDGSLIEDTRQNVSNTSRFDDEDSPETHSQSQKSREVEKKPIGFKRLMDISLLKPPILNVEVSNRPGFWHLFDTELKGDFIVLIIKILSDVYNSLESEERSKITMLLETRFVKSNFLNRLKNYLNSLPSLRIVEKRMNMQLWDDIETFYFDVLELCKGMVKFHQKDVNIMLEIMDLLDAAEVSALGVIEEHKESIKNNFFDELNQLIKDILEITDQKTENMPPRENYQCIKDPANFKNLSIFPTKQDLLGDNNVKIQPNIINGAYPTVEHYLDLQFKLLREDCFAPLREGICKYVENPSKRRHENLRIYPKVRIIRTYVSNNKVGHLVDIAWQDRLADSSIDKKQYAFNKKLMFGSLLLFTCDQFETILCASVLDSNLNLLSNGHIVVSFQNPVSNTIYTQPYLMVESGVFFEPYHRVLAVLQKMKFDNLPMKKYIVDVQAEPQPPSYLTPETTYSIRDNVNGEEIDFPVLDSDRWPAKESFGLDESQMHAFEFSITRQFAVIQGPPGTGKTFLGIKIASMLLRNLSLEGTPMIIICYTNHALDQFLEGILNITDKVIRLGSQSKNSVLQNYTLNSMRGKTKSKYSYLYSRKRSELERIYKQMTEVQTEIEKCEKELVSYKTLKPYLTVGNKSYELKLTNEDPIASWLFGHLNGESDDLRRDQEQDEEVDNWEKQYEELSVSEKVETCFSEEWALKEIQSMMNSIKYVKDLTDNEKESRKMVERFQDQITKLQNRLDYFKKNMSISQKDEHVNSDIAKGDDLYKLAPEERWKVYLAAAEALKDKLATTMNGLMERHNACGEELAEVGAALDGELVGAARVVGATTSAAARSHQLLAKVPSPIVIVEEAAEVLEAHIVASITSHCQHLILIGDHKQLRPTAAHYKLARDYNLDISLFERMLRNGVHARTLATQRRMRDSFAQLLVPVIYDKLVSHPLVLAYPPVKGMADDLYFFDHTRPEDTEGMEDSWSHRNTHEAEWCLALANYLRRRGYGSEAITILATYTGQATLMRDLSKRYDLLRDVKITVVDNYQGEENRIVILSLVRSNREGNIGFLKEGNRICVAMSRAKEGFYIFGNMGALRSASPIWRSIGDKLEAQNAVGGRITLRCDTHTGVTSSIYRYEDFDGCLAPNGVCLKNCTN